MTRKFAWSADSTMSARRTLIYAVLLFAHSALMLLLLRPPSPMQQPAPPAAQPTHVMWLAPWKRQPSPDAVPGTLAAAPYTLPLRQVSSRTKRHVAPAAESRPPPIATATLQPSTEEQATTPAPFTRAHGPDYVPGGTLLGHGDAQASPAPHLPGSDHAIVQGIQLIDPEQQGIKGFVHRLQGRFGVPDRHCVDVDAWRAMTVEQLIERHLSPTDVENEAQRYDCNKAYPLGHPRTG